MSDNNQNEKYLDSEWLGIENTFIRIRDISEVSCADKGGIFEKSCVVISLTNGNKITKEIDDPLGARNLFETLKMVLSSSSKNGDKSNIVNIHLDYNEKKKDGGE